MLHPSTPTPFRRKMVIYADDDADDIYKLATREIRTIHNLNVTPTRCLIEMAGGVFERPAYFNQDYMLFEKGNIFLNPKPGLGVAFDPKKATFVMEITENTKYPHPILKAPGGSIYNW